MRVPNGNALADGSNLLWRYLAALAFVLFTAIALPAQAFIDPPVVVPARPVADQLVSFDVRIGVCEYFQAFGPSDATTIYADDRWRTIVQTGNTLQVTVRTVFADEPILCVYPTANFRFRLAALPPGPYRLELYGQAISDPDFRPLIGTAQFTVGQAPVAVSGLTWEWMVILIALLGVASGRAMRAHGSVVRAGRPKPEAP